MHRALGDQIDRTAEHFDQAVLELEHVEAQARPRSELVEQIDVAVLRRLAPGHGPEDRQLGHAVTCAELGQASRVDRAPVDFDHFGGSHKPIVASTSPHAYHPTTCGDGPVPVIPCGVRAIMRAEAELLAEDADAFDPGRENGTPEERRTNALFEIVTAAAAAPGF